MNSNKLTIEDKIREDSLVNMPENLRVLYSYSRQILEVPIDCKQCGDIPCKLIYAVLQAEKGNYEPLEEQRQFLIDYSMRL